MRELLLRAPTDVRVLRRAAAILRSLGDETLANGFDQAAAQSHGQGLTELARQFIDMDDARLALVLADGALARDRGLLAAVLIGAEALAHMGRHRQALERLATVSHSADAALAMRAALSAVHVGDMERFGDVVDDLPDGAAWLEAAALRAHAFPDSDDEDTKQRMLFVLYGTLLLDDAAEGEVLDAARIARWLTAVAQLAGETLDPETRPAWVSPRGEVLARWLGSLMPVNAALPLSARLPRQPVLVVLADDEDLATLVAMKVWHDAPAPLFQALKDPCEVGSPMADVVGVFAAGVTLPLGSLEAERAADRVPPKMVASGLEREAGRIDPVDLAGFIGWAQARREHLSWLNPPPAELRIALVGDAPSND